MTNEALTLAEQIVARGRALAGAMDRVADRDDNVANLRAALTLIDDLRVTTERSATLQSMDDFLLAVRRHIAIVLARLESTK